MKKIIIIITFLLVSCGFQKINKRVPPPPPELVEYIEHFELYYNVKIDYSVGFEDLTPPIIGVCKIYRNGLPEVRIDKAFFEEYKDDYYTIHEVLWHEFGHCSFRLGHDSALLNSGNPASIMYPYAFGMYDFYVDNIDYYEEELDHKRISGITEFEAGHVCMIKHLTPASKDDTISPEQPPVTPCEGKNGKGCKKPKKDKKTKDLPM